MEALIGGCLLFLVIIAFVAGINCLLAFPLMWFWNMLVPELFNGPEMLWRHAFAALMLVSFFLGAKVNFTKKD